MDYAEVLKLNSQAETLLKVGIQVKIIGGKWQNKTGTIIKHDPLLGMYEWLVEIRHAKKKYPVKLFFNAAALIPTIDKS